MVVVVNTVIWNLLMHAASTSGPGILLANGIQLLAELDDLLSAN